MTDMTPGHAGMTEADFAYLERLAAAAAESGLYGRSANVKAQLLMKLIYGRDLQIPVSAALSAIDIYDGKMELSSNLIAALLEAHPHYAYAIVETTNERCELEFFKDGSSLGKAKFDATDATTAGLADTDYYRHYPSDMFFARAITRGARRYCPGLGRGVAIYATGELAKRTPEPTTTNGRRPPHGERPIRGSRQRHGSRADPRARRRSASQRRGPLQRPDRRGRPGTGEGRAARGAAARSSAGQPPGPPRPQGHRCAEAARGDADRGGERQRQRLRRDSS